MKKGTSRHPKMKKLARLLGISRHAAVGLMTDLWEWSGQYAPRGDIGTHSNQDIADGIEWDDTVKTADDVVQALVDAEWLDYCDVNRLVIHDWEDHCEAWVKKRVDRAGKVFVKAVKLKDNGLFGGSADNGRQRQTTSDEVRLRAGGASACAGASAGGSPEGGPPPDAPPPDTPDTPDDGEPDGFAAWWDLYPNKVGIKAAREAYRAALAEATPEALRSALPRYIAGKPKDRPWLNPATWLKDGRWMDDPAAPDQKPKNGVAALSDEARADLWAFVQQHEPDAVAYRAPMDHQRHLLRRYYDRWQADRARAPAG